MPDASMRAAVICHPRHTELREVAVPRPGPGQVLIQIEGCGVSGSNLPLWDGRPWFDYPVAPGTPGHEGWGRVVCVGPDVSGAAEGDRVVFLSGRAFADYDVCSQDALVVLPPVLDGQDVPGEPLGRAMNIWRRSEIGPEHTVAVIGVGFFGALLTQLAARAGAQVIAISRRPFSLDLARRMGAAHTIALGDDDDSVAEQVAELTCGRGCDRVIEAVGAQRTLDLAGKLCRVRARLVIVGFHQDGPRQVDVGLWNWRGLDVINAHERDRAVCVHGIHSALDAVVSGHLELAPLLSHRVTLEYAQQAFELLHDRPDGFVKAVVIP